MRLWIMDNDQTPQRFPVQRLLWEVVHVTGTKANVCNIIRAKGYGLQIRELEEMLDSVDAVSIPIAELDELSTGIEEWFFDLEAEIPGTGLRFGLHDSTALFVEGERALTEAVAAA